MTTCLPSLAHFARGAGRLRRRRKELRPAAEGWERTRANARGGSQEHRGARPALGSSPTPTPAQFSRRPSIRAGCAEGYGQELTCPGTLYLGTRLPGRAYPAHLTSALYPPSRANAFRPGFSRRHKQTLQLRLNGSILEKEKLRCHTVNVLAGKPVTLQTTLTPVCLVAGLSTALQGLAQPGLQNSSQQSSREESFLCWKRGWGGG